MEALTKFCEWVRKKRLELWKKESWILHQDYAPALSSYTMKQFVADKCIPILKTLICSPDLATCDFYLFPKMKSVQKGTNFQSVNKTK
jgi:hypothetical protein